MSLSVSVLKEYEETIVGALDTVQNTAAQLEFLRSELKGALIGVKAYHKCIEAITQEIPPMENDFARGIAEGVEVAQDIEHMVPPPAAGEE